MVKARDGYQIHEEGGAAHKDPAVDTTLHVEHSAERAFSESFATVIQFFLFKKRSLPK